MVQASAPAKIILFGEHAVVYGQPAIAVPISTLRAVATILKGLPGQGLRVISRDLNKMLPIMTGSSVVDDALAVTARAILDKLQADAPDVDIVLESQIPIASGLGSGAAISTALARAVASAVGHELSSELLNQMIFETERMYHGTPSGIDNTVVVYEQPVYFVKGQPIELLSIAHAMTLVVADTGLAAPTKVAVDDVRALYERAPQKYTPVLLEIGDIARQARRAIGAGNIAALGPLMIENHRLLGELTVSSLGLDHLVEVALQVGALGAKLSGGGRGGNMIALVNPEEAETVRNALLSAGAVRAFVTKIG